MHINKTTNFATEIHRLPIYIRTRIIPHKNIIYTTLCKMQQIYYIHNAFD